MRLFFENVHPDDQDRCRDYFLQVRLEQDPGDMFVRFYREKVQRIFRLHMDDIPQSDNLPDKPCIQVADFTDLFVVKDCYVRDLEQLEEYVSERTQELSEALENCRLEIQKKNHDLDNLKIYEAMFTASLDARLFVDSCLRIKAVNPAYENFFGLDREQLVGRSYPVFLLDMYGAKEYKKNVKPGLRMILEGRSVSFLPSVSLLRLAQISKEYSIFSICCLK